MNRSAKNAHKKLRDRRRFQSVENTSVTEIAKNSTGDTTRLILERIKTFGLKTMLHMGQHRPSSMEFSLLRRFVAHVTRAEKIVGERDLKVDTRTESSAAERQSKTDSNQAGGQNP